MEIPVGEEDDYYPCQTQKYPGPTYAEPPPSKNKFEGDAIVVGLGPRCPRWDVTEEPNRKLLYYIPNRQLSN